MLDDTVGVGVPDVHAEGEVRLGFHGQVPTRLVLARRYLYSMLLRPEYLSQNLAAPIHTKDGGTLRTHSGCACAYMAAISKERRRATFHLHAPPSMRDIRSSAARFSISGATSQ